MTINNLKLQLLRFLTKKEIENLCKKIRNEKKDGRPRFIHKYFREKHLERRLTAILKTYEKGIDNV